MKLVELLVIEKKYPASFKDVKDMLYDAVRKGQLDLFDRIIEKCQKISANFADPDYKQLLVNCVWSMIRANRISVLLNISSDPEVAELTLRKNMIIFLLENNFDKAKYPTIKQVLDKIKTSGGEEATEITIGRFNRILRKSLSLTTEFGFFRDNEKQDPLLLDKNVGSDNSHDHTSSANL